MTSKVKYTLIGIVGATIVLTPLALYVFKKLFGKKAKLINTALYEWQGWGETTLDGRIVKKGGKEEQKGFTDRVAKYWKEGVGLNYTGQNKDVAWSSAFISFLMKIAGYGKDFVYSASHSDYITAFIKNRKDGNTKATFVGYKINEKNYEVGDLICYSRQDGVTYDTVGNYASHCDLIVAKRPNEIEVIGGNVSDSVTKKILPLDTSGNLGDRSHKWFAHIKNNS